MRSSDSGAEPAPGRLQRGLPPADLLDVTSTCGVQPRRCRAPALAAVALLVPVLAGCVPSGADDRPVPRPSVATQTSSAAPTAPTSSVAPSAPTGLSTTPATPRGAAAVALASLAIKGRAPQTGYDRELFGQRWADTDRNGCDTRNDVLRRDLSDVVLDPATNGCVVLSGTLADPFSGRSLDFQRGQDTSQAVQIDHVVALSDAWQKGAQQWSPARRLAFANDPLNLLAVDGPLNQQKSDGDAATWLPPQSSFRCAYVARQVAVKAKYGAWVTQAEHDVVAGLLAGCAGEPLPGSHLPVESDLGTAAATETETETSTAPAPAPVPGASPPGDGCDPAYPGACIPSPAAAGGDLDCGDVPDRRFAVLAPDPHRFDGDGNGVGCESD